MPTEHSPTPDVSPPLPDQRAAEIDGIVKRARQWLEQGKQPPSDEVLAEKFPHLMPQLGQAMAKVRLIARARRNAEAPTNDDTIALGKTKAAGTIRSFGDYELLAELGRGGMGVVYIASQTRLDRLVALKMILSGSSAAQEDIDRFHLEAKAAAKLRHPNIVKVYESGEHEGDHYFSMDYIEGRTLSALCREQVLPSREAAAHLEKLALAVAYAHEQGVVHRDLKPANVLVDQRDDPHITDFGLAKRIDVDSNLTATGKILGTPSYMAPEQAMGDSQEVGPASDIYALGGVLYFMLTGRPPFQGESHVATMLQVMHEEPVSPRLLNPSVDRDLETITLKCLEKEPQNRYATAGALASEMGRYLREEPILARPISRPAKAWRWCRRNPWVAALLATVVFTLMAGIAATSTMAVIAQRNANRAETEVVKTKAAEQRAVQQKELADKSAERAKVAEAAAESESLRASEEAKRASLEAQKATAEKERSEIQTQRAEKRLYFSQIQLADQEWQDGDVQAMIDRLQFSNPKLRGWEYGHLKWRLTNAHKAWQLPEKTTCMHLDRTGRHLVAVDKDGSVIKWTAARPDAVTTLPSFFTYAPERIVSLANGTKFATVERERDIKIWDATTAGVEVVLRGHQGPVDAFDVTFDGKLVAYAKRSLIRIVSTLDRRQVAEITTDSRVTAIAFNEKGTRLVSGHLNGSLSLWNTSTGALAARLGGQTAPVSCVDYESSNRVASGSQDGNVRIWDAGDQTLLFTSDVQTSTILSVKLSHQGTRVAFAGHDKVVTVCDVNSGLVIKKLAGHRSHIGHVAFRDQDDKIVSVSVRGTVKLWETDARPDARILTGHSSAVSCLSFSPDGSRLVTGSQDGTIRMWDTATGNTLYTIQQYISAVAFAPSGLFFVATCNDGSLKAWDAPKGRNLFSATDLPGSSSLSGDAKGVPHIGYDGRFTYLSLIRGFAFHPSGNMLTVAELDRISLRDSATGKLLRRFGGFDRANCIAISPDGRKLATGDRLGMAKIWDLATGRELTKFGGHSNDVFSVTFSPDGSRVASTSSTLKVWDAKTGGEFFTARDHSAFDPIHRTCYSPDGSRIATRSRTSVIVWDADSGLESLVINVRPQWHADITFSPDGRYIACGSGNDILMFGCATLDQAVALRDDFASPSPPPAFSSDGERIASAGHDAPIQVHDAKTGERLITVNRDAVRAGSRLALSADGRQIAVGGVTSRIFDIETGDTLEVAITQGARLSTVVFGARGKLLIGGGTDGVLSVYSADGKNAYWTAKAHGNNVWTLSVCGMGRRIASSAFLSRETKIWDLQNGDHLYTLHANTGRSVFSATAFSPDGKQVVTVDEEQLYVWNAQTGALEETLEHEPWKLADVAVTSDGQYVVAMGVRQDREMTMAICRLPEKRLREYDVSSFGGVQGIQISPDASRFAYYDTRVLLVSPISLPDLNTN